MNFPIILLTFGCIVMVGMAHNTSAQASSFPSIANKEVVIEEFPIAYMDEGTGKTLLCLHPIGHSSKDFASLIGGLDLNQYRIIALDFPSHGKSGQGKENATATYYCSVVSKFMEVMDLKDVIVIGNSIGGATGIRLAASNANIRSIILSNPGGLDKGGILAKLFLNQMVRFFRKGERLKPSFQRKFESYYKKVLPSEAANNRRIEITNDAYHLAPLLRQAWTGFNTPEEDLRPLIKQITCPVLFAWCVKDKYVQLGRNRKAIESFSNYSLVTYEAGHSPYLECPDQFIKDLEGFLKDQDL